MARQASKLRRRAASPFPNRFVRPGEGAWESRDFVVISIVERQSDKWKRYIRVKVKRYEYGATLLRYAAYLRGVQLHLPADNESYNWPD